MTAAWALTIEGTPVPWKRAGRNGGQTFTPPKLRKWQDRVRDTAWAAEPRGRMLPQGMVAVVLVVVRPPCKVDGTELASRGGDADNLAKGVLDALQTTRTRVGWAWDDDSEVRALPVVCQPGSRKPGIDITCWWVREERWGHAASALAEAFRSAAGALACPPAALGDRA